MLFLGKAGECWFAHYLSREQIKRSMNKGERISQFVAELGDEDVDPDQTNIAKHPSTARFSNAGTNNAITRHMMCSSSFGSRPNRAMQTISKG